MLFNICLILFVFFCMMGSCCLALAAWYRHDLRISDVAQALVSILCFGAISWICILG